jgi:hypothetical protein
MILGAATRVAADLWSQAELCSFDVRTPAIDFHAPYLLDYNNRSSFSTARFDVFRGVTILAPVFQTNFGRRCRLSRQEMHKTPCFRLSRGGNFNPIVGVFFHN